MFEEIIQKVKDLKEYVSSLSSDSLDDPDQILRQIDHDLVEIKVEIGECGKVGVPEKEEIGNEISDLLINLMRIAILYDIDMEKIFADRCEEIKKKFEEANK